MSEQGPKELHCWTDGETTVSAYSAEDAVDVLYTECGVDQPTDAEEFTRVDGDTKITVRSDDHGDPSVATKTAREWAAEGRGPVCSTEW